MLLPILMIGLLLCIPVARPLKHLFVREKAPWLKPDETIWRYHLNAAMATPFALIDYMRYGEADFSKQKLIALTFDDGPYPLYTPLLLDVLQRYGVHATFFVVGNSVQQYPQLVRQVRAAGHDIANHTYTHRRQRDLNAAEFRQELIKTEEAIEIATGDRPNCFRPAGGAVNEEGQAIVQELGYTLCNATINPGDWWQRDPDILIHSSYRGRTREGITLMHSGALGIIKAMPGYINALKAKGFRFVTLSELAEAQGRPLPKNPRAHPHDVTGTLVSPGALSSANTAGGEGGH